MHRMARESKNANAAHGPNKLDWTIALQLLDTTWRVALPILLLTYLGHKLDDGMGTNPLFIMGGLFLGLAVAGLLVYRQIQLAYPDFFKKVGK
jgi:hypothetical protein